MRCWQMMVLVCLVVSHCSCETNFGLSSTDQHVSEAHISHFRQVVLTQKSNHANSTHDDVNIECDPENKTPTGVNKDCPNDSVCIRSQCSNSSSVYRCSCDHLDSMQRMVPSTGECEPTASTIAYTTFWVLNAIVCIFIAAHMFYSIYISNKYGVFRIDVMNSACLINLVSAVLQALHRFLFARLVMGRMSRARFARLNLTIVILDACYALTIFTSALVFGVGVLDVVTSSQNLRRVNANEMRRRVTCIATIVGIFIFVGALLLIAYNQIASAYSYFGFAAICVWILFRRIHKNSIGLQGDAPAKRSIGQSQSQQQQATRSVMLVCHVSSDNLPPPSSAVPRPSLLSPSQYAAQHSQDLSSFTTTITSSSTATTASTSSSHHRPSSSSQILSVINKLAVRLGFVLAIYIVLACIFNVMWHVGSSTCDASMLGPGTAAINALTYVTLTSGVWLLAWLMRQIAEIRIAHQKLQRESSSQSTGRTGMIASGSAGRSAAVV